MVDIETLVSLAALSNSMALTPSRRGTLQNMDNKPNFSEGAKLQWAGSRDRNLGLRSRRSFLLDIPFYRTH
jgi:hypothetical protein